MGIYGGNKSDKKQTQNQVTSNNTGLLKSRQGSVVTFAAPAPVLEVPHGDNGTTASQGDLQSTQVSSTGVKEDLFMEHGWTSDIIMDDEDLENNNSGNNNDNHGAIGISRGGMGLLRAHKNSASKLPQVVETVDEDLSNSASSSGLFGLHSKHWANTRLITILILALTLGTSAAFLTLGIKGAKNREEDDFHRDALDVVHNIQAAWEEYVNAASLVHGRCRDGTFTRKDFRELYEYLMAGGLDFKAVQFDPFVPHKDRDAREAEARAYYAEHYPHVNYQGIRGFEPGIPGLSPRSNQSFYYPIHFQEPIPGNEAAIDLDYYSSESRRQTVHAVLETGLPAATPRLLLVKTSDAVNRCTPDDADAYGIVLMHPGVNLTTQPDVWPHEFSSIVICMPQLLFKSTEKQGKSAKVYVHDSSTASDEVPPDFLGALRVNVESADQKFQLLDEIPLSELRGGRHDLMYRQVIPVANRQWTVTVVPLDDEYDPHLAFVILGGVLICVAGICLALWIYTNTLRMTKFNQLKAQAEAEKAQLILDNARQATKAERELNDFIAHEVRNPVAAAMAATSFIKAAVFKEPPLADQESKESTREDIGVIDSALKFINDLLRNMLDMHRAADKQLKVEKSVTDVLHDVLEPVHAMLHQKREGRIEVQIKCEPQQLHIMTDALRLKQVMLNLGRNSSKFVHEGFIRLRAGVVDGSVQLYVEDSGSGIPPEKRERLFSKFQESLDRLSQGTGIGLYLCKNLVELLGGEISLDDDYDSGIEGHPGTRFVIDLKVPPLDPPCEDDSSSAFVADAADGNNYANNGDTGTEGTGTSSVSSQPLATETKAAKLTPEQRELPEALSVLLVDDDVMIRKMFSRAVGKVAPGWTFRQAASGEASLRITETEEFDLIFMDMYMASVEKQLLGSETVREMRERGIKSRICGLSANDKEMEFLDAGADAFTIKPFPCAPAALTAELLRVLYG